MFTPNTNRTGRIFAAALQKLSAGVILAALVMSCYNNNVWEEANRPLSENEQTVDPPADNTDNTPGENTDPENVRVTGITVEPQELELKIGYEYRLTPAVEPQNADDRTVTFTTDNAAVAAVTASGTVAAHAAGTAVITAKTRDGDFTDECTVTVVHAPAAVAVRSVTTHNGAITVNWDDPAEADLESVRVVCLNTGDSSTEEYTVAKGAEMITISPLTNDVPYRVSIYSRTESGRESVAETFTLAPTASDTVYRAVYTPAEMNDVRDDVAANYILMENIDLSGYAAGTGWMPVEETGAVYFSGIFEGNGHVISNLTVNNPSLDHAGLFSATAPGSSILNLALENVSVTGNENVGGLAGKISGAVSHCRVTGQVTGKFKVGGIIGELTDLTADLRDCTFSGTVYGFTMVGGIAGQALSDIRSCEVSAAINATGISPLRIGGVTGLLHPSAAIKNSRSVIEINAGSAASVGGIAGEIIVNSGGIISGCHASGSIDGTGVRYGGIAGYQNSNAFYIENCGASVDITTTGNSAGGLVGENIGLVNSCHATGDIAGAENVGGLVDDNQESLLLCYATGDVAGAKNVGGLVGSNRAFVERSYATGAVTGTERIGGLVGYSLTISGRIKNCFAAGTVIAANYGGGITGFLAQDSAVSLCYSVGSVTSTSNRGGLVGFNNAGTINTSVYDRDTSGCSDSGKGVPLTTPQMQTAATDTSLHWSSGTWNISDGSYPVLQGLPSPY